MKNIVDLREDGSRWRLLRQEAPVGVFHAWGATEVYPVSDWDHSNCQHVYMLRMSDGWHYAHEASDRRSCYMSEEALAAPDGRSAWLLHLMCGAARNVEMARSRLAAAERCFDNAQTEYAKALWESGAKVKQTPAVATPEGGAHV